jgi:hypothetical protein
MSMCLIYSSYYIQDPNPKRKVSVSWFPQRMMLLRPISSMFAGNSPQRPADQILLSLHSVYDCRSFKSKGVIWFPKSFSERSIVQIDSFVAIGLTSPLLNPVNEKVHLMMLSFKRDFDFAIWVPICSKEASPIANPQIESS